MGETIRFILFVSDLQSDISDSALSWGDAPSFDVSDLQSVECSYAALFDLNRKNNY